MKLSDYLCSERGVFPFIILWAILIGLGMGIIGGVIAYLLTRAAASFLFGVAVCIIFFVVVLPNLSAISGWWKKVINQFKKVTNQLKDKEKESARDEEKE